MRLKVAGARRVVKGDLAIEFTDDRLTSYAGLELLRQYWNRIDLSGRLRRALEPCNLGGDYQGSRMVVLLMVLMLVGARRVAQLKYLGGDPIVRRATDLERLPSMMTVRTWLKRFTRERVAALSTLNTELVAEHLSDLRLPRVTLDVDGTVVRTGDQVEWALRGFNPHHPKDKSYYPIMVHVAQTSQILCLKNRPGNVHDSKGSARFVRQAIGDIRRRLGDAVTLECRMDAAFFKRDMIEMLTRERCDYAIKVPFCSWVGVRTMIAERKEWTPINAKLSYFESRLSLEVWNLDLRVVIYRKRVAHRTAKNFQLDLFSPDDGYYEYSAITTNKALGGTALWHFMAGRGAHEKTIAELKGEFALDVVPTRHYGANSAWQQISILSHNLLKAFQLATTAEQKPRSRKRTAAYLLKNARTMRFELIARAARLCRPSGRQVLKLPGDAVTRALYNRLIQRLAA